MRELLIKNWLLEIKKAITEDPTISMDEATIRLQKMPRATLMIPHWYYRRLQSGTDRKNKKLKFTVSEDYLNILLQKQGYRCALSGEELWFCENQCDAAYQNASLDRIDNNIGYEEGNLQWVVKEINFLKGTMTQHRLIEFCQKIAMHTLEVSSKEELLITLKQKGEQEIIAFKKLQETKEDASVELFFKFIEENQEVISQEKPIKGAVLKEDSFIIFHYPTYYAKFKAAYPKAALSNKKLREAIISKPWFMDYKLKRFNGKPMRVFVIKVDEKSPEFIHNVCKLCPDTPRLGD